MGKRPNGGHESPRDLRFGRVSPNRCCHKVLKKESGTLGREQRGLGELLGRGGGRHELSSFHGREPKLLVAAEV